MVALLLALRLWHLGPAIDAPHDWRQCDTAYYIRDFYQNGIDLLHPAVCWMGAADTLALEFPLPEALVALAYQPCGESIPLARVIFLCFFGAALYYFYRAAELLFGRLVAQWAALVYLVLPLSLFYSRAIHIDFSVLLLVHAMLYYFLLGLRQRRRAYLLLSSLAAALALMIKAPYVVALAPPMLWYAWRQNALGWSLRSAWAYGLAVLAFVCWQQHVYRINSAAPDWSFILHYRKMVQSAGWYFGTWQQRVSLYSWWVLLQRGVLDLAGPGGILVLLAGAWQLRRLANWPFLGWWMLGLVGYVLVFFNLNVVHNYYQIPLLGPVALLCAQALHQLAAQKPALAPGLFGLLLAGNVAFTETAWYRVSEDHVEIGRLIDTHTPEAALVIVTYRDMDCRNPKLLYRARRRGWSVEEAALRPGLIGRLHREAGARYWAYVGERPPRAQAGADLDSLPAPEVFPLASVPRQLYLFDLSAPE